MADEQPQDRHQRAREIINKELSAILQREAEGVRILQQAESRLQATRREKEDLIASLDLLGNATSEDPEEGGKFGIGAPITWLGAGGDEIGYVTRTSGAGWREIEVHKDATEPRHLTVHLSDLQYRPGAGTATIISGKVARSGAKFRTRAKDTLVTLTRKVSMHPPRWEIETGDARNIQVVLEEELY